MDRSTTWDADVILADGSLATIRPVRPDDGERFVDFYSRVSDQSKYLRFFASHPELTDADLAALVDVDLHDAATLVLTEDEEIIATARYALVESQLPARVADVSFLVQDDHQGRGAANILLEHLAQVGRESGIERFFAEMLTNNQSMKQVFVRAGYDVRPELEDGFITVDFTIDPTERSRTVMAQREHRAEAASIRRMLSPSSIAVIGEEVRVNPVVRAIKEGGYTGRVVTDLDDTDSRIDLVISDYDTGSMGNLLERARRHGAHGLIFLARGFNPNLSAEQSAEFVAQARDHGMRALGPASLGLVNSDPEISLNAVPVRVSPGRVGLFTQTAGIATLALSHAVARKCGLSTFIASGAYADVTANDVMQFWTDHEATDICLLSLDAVGNPRKFIRILRRLALEKHVVIFTPSRALRSARHHDSEQLIAAPPEALDEAIRATGTMVVSRRETMFDIAELLAHQPVPPGRRVTVISNSTGLTNQMAQAARRFGLEPTPVTTDGEPVAALVSASQRALDSGIDIVLTAAVEISEPILAGVAAGLERLAATTTDTTLAGVFVGLHDVPPLPERRRLPSFTAYGDVLEALSLIIGSEERRADARPTPADEYAASGRTAAQAVVDDFLGANPGGGWLSDPAAAGLLAAYDINLIPWRPVATLDEAVAAGEHFGWGVVLKATHPMVRGRAELATIIRSIAGPESMTRAWAALAGLAEDLRVNDVAELAPVVQPLVPAGTTLTARAIEDPVLGPLIRIGATGVASDLLGDVSFSAPPMRRSDARRMLERLRSAPLLTGYRGSPPADTAGVEKLLMSLALLKDEISSIAEVELSPIIAAPAGTSVAGARVRIVPLPAERDPLARLL